MPSSTGSDRGTTPSDEKSTRPQPSPTPPETVEWESPAHDRVDPVAEEQRPSRTEQLRQRLSPKSDDPAPDAPVAAAAPVADDRLVGETAPVTSRAVVTEDDIEVLTGGEDLGMYRAHRRYGGFDAGAALAGLLAATGMTALLGGIAGAIGTIGYQLDTDASTDTMSTGGFVAGLVVLLLSFLVGGWVAGRVARYEGGLNGLVSAGLFIVLSAIMAGMGAWFGDRYDVFADIRLPQWFSNTTSTTAVLSAVVALVVMVAAGWFGGVLGSRYHRRVDTYLAEYAQGGRPVTADALIDDSHTRKRHLLHR